MSVGGLDKLQVKHYESLCLDSYLSFLQQQTERNEVEQPLFKEGEMLVSRATQATEAE